jgi:SAM-dependent methyltransferase
MKEVLHVGCSGNTLPPQMAHLKETRLDIDPQSNPDIVGDMADLPQGIGPYDAIFASHCLEHLPFNKIQPCLKGWLNVLKPGGVVILFLPDLEDLTPTDEVLYEAVCGPIKARDLFYGYSEFIEQHPYMQHLSGFTAATLRKHLEDAGFANVTVVREGGGCYNLSAVGVRPK